MDNLGISFQKLNRLLKGALREDLQTGDVTSSAIIPSSFIGKAEIIAKSRGILCGMEICSRLFLLTDRTLRLRTLARDGDLVRPGSRIAVIRGRLRSILATERVALNFIAHLSGIATLTRSFVNAVKPYDCKIYDTRKTTPLLRPLEKYAVRIGGGVNHRLGLHDMILIKDNHIDAIGDVSEAIQRARLHNPRRLTIACETRNLAEVKHALLARANIILLDNMNTRTVKEALKIVADKAEVEVSGGISIPRARQLARIGVKRISVGKITHSAPSLDFSLTYLIS
jgi:nicotinate-nucleotide pyrophosphorylase (carboxylating)